MNNRNGAIDTKRAIDALSVPDTSSGPDIFVPDMLSVPDMPLRLEAWAQIEEHFAGNDRLIAAWLAASRSRRPNVAFVRNLRETRFSYWRHLEDRARTEPRLPIDGTEREYLPGYVRPSERRASLMHRLSPDWLGWLLIAAGCTLFLAWSAFPGLADFLKGLFR